MSVSVDVERVEVPAAAPAGPVERLRTTRAEDAVMAVLSCWFMGGLFLDGWAHKNVPDLETLLTPWHAVFYSGFAATTLWMLFLVIRRHRGGRSWAAAVPAGYGISLVAVGTFLASAAGDITWHLFFGFEESIAALVSPTHLLLFTSVAVIVLSAYRSLRGRPEDAPASLVVFLPALISLTLVAAQVTLDLGYLSVLATRLPALRFQGVAYLVQASGRATPIGGPNTLEALGLGQVFASSVILTAPVLLLVRRWRIPFGSLTILFSVAAFMVGATNEMKPLSSIIALAAAGVVADVVVWVLQPSGARVWAYRTAAVLVPLGVTSLYLASVQATVRVTWPAHLWVGSLVLSGLTGLGLSLLMLQRDAEGPSG